MTALTETQIERHVERAFDRLDKQFMSTDLTQADYDEMVRVISAWADGEYAKLRRPAPFVDISTINEYGLEQKLSNAIRCF